MNWRQIEAATHTLSLQLRAARRTFEGDDDSYAEFLRRVEDEIDAIRLECEDADGDDGGAGPRDRTRRPWVRVNGHRVSLGRLAEATEVREATEAV